jgi:hypothetical protein
MVPRSVLSPTMFLIAAALGAGCVAAVVIGSHFLGSEIPEELGQRIWLAGVLGGSAVCGYFAPDRPWRWGATILAAQPPTLFIILLFVGEILKPSSSTGGMVAVFIFATFLLVVSPAAMLASFLGSRVRRGIVHWRGRA